MGVSVRCMCLVGVLVVWFFVACRDGLRVVVGLERC